MPVQIPQTEAEMIRGGAIGGIGVAAGKALDGAAEMFFGGDKLAAAQVPEAQGIVAAGIHRVAPERLAPVEFRGTRGVAVLFQMQTGNVELVVTRNVRRGGRF